MRTRYPAEFRRKVLDLVEAGRPVALLKLETQVGASLIHRDPVGGEPFSGTGTLLKTVHSSAQLPATVNLGSTAAVKEAVHAGRGISLILASSADTEVRGRLHTWPSTTPACARPSGSPTARLSAQERQT